LDPRQKKKENKLSKLFKTLINNFVKINLILSQNSIGVVVSKNKQLNFIKLSEFTVIGEQKSEAVNYVLPFRSSPLIFLREFTGFIPKLF